MRKICVIAAALAVTAAAHAGQPDSIDVLRPVTSAWTIAAGSAHRCDTYLTPLHYTGWNVAVGYERFQATGFAPDTWVRALDSNVSVDRTLNPVRNSQLWGANIKGRWAAMHRWNITSALTLGIGPSTTLNAGALYMSRNGNNPVAANVSWTVDASAYAVYRLTIGRLPVVAMYRATLPVTGAFFTPDYGQLYYELYLGDSKGVVSAAWWGNYFALDQRITADLRLGATALRLGYGVDIMSTDVHHTVTRRITHCAILGVSGEWISLSPTHKIDETARIISAIY